jgi:hypothetical protein
VARFPRTQDGGIATTVPLAPGLLAEPVGIAFATDGAAYVASKGNSSLVRIDGAGGTSAYPLPVHSEPFDLAPAADGSVLITDNNSARILRFTPTPPTGPPTPTSPSASPAAPSISPSTPTAPRDLAPPRGTIGAARSQALGKAVTVTASCPAESCRALATGMLVLGMKSSKSKPKSYPLVAAKASLSAGKAVPLKLKVPAEARRAAARTLAAGGTAIAKIVLKVTDTAGNTSKPIRRSLDLTG